MKRKPSVRAIALVCSILTTLAMTSLVIGEKKDRTTDLNEKSTTNNRVDYSTSESALNTNRVEKVDARIGAASNRQSIGLYHDKVLVLTYHHISEMTLTPSTITPKLFAAHMNYFKQHNYQPITAEQYASFLQKKTAVPDNAILITFDDGYESLYTEAYPLLKRLQFPSLAFVVVGHLRELGTVMDSRFYIPKLTWEQVQEMDRSGWVTIGSHTYDLHRYQTVNESGKERPELLGPRYEKSLGSKETPDKFEQRIRLDLELSRLQLEKRLGHPVPYFAFPYGAYNSRAVDIAKEAGFAELFGFSPGISQPGGNEPTIYRYDIGRPEMTVEKLAQWLKSIEYQTEKSTEK